MKRDHKWTVVGEKAGVMVEYCEWCGLTSEEYDGEAECDGPSSVEVRGQMHAPTCDVVEKPLFGNCTCGK